MLHCNPGVDQPSLVNGKGAVDQLCRRGDARMAGLLVKAESLARDDRNPTQFTVSRRQVFLSLWLDRRLASKVEEIGYRFKGVVNLMRDGGCQTANSG